ncbi:hypothetical protein GCM10010289_35330 [Streptomyces violascens]|uniref:Uncharacterized protein n=1 Tax=Streptomyces violascens TaxID=67381 RepID=A0ABQ3R1E8_9ACTN|nr:hypothetical protein GCM10010289_35330 [Streptomyces violascens]GHI43356.1 hypothetical protein Sviol_77640 [Streptomyces violascens]
MRPGSRVTWGWLMRAMKQPGVVESGTHTRGAAEPLRRGLAPFDLRTVRGCARSSPRPWEVRPLRGARAARPDPADEQAPTPFGLRTVGGGSRSSPRPWRG